MKPKDPKDCLDGFFWDWTVNNCTPCAYGCLTCELTAKNCTSCIVGRFLTDKSSCEVCETFWSNNMIVGTSGKCLETCGDGKNFGLNMCDDGNLKSGDGCSANCITEKDYICSGGYPYSKDVCTYIPSEIVGVEVNKYNDLIIKFSRPI